MCCGLYVWQTLSRPLRMRPKRSPVSDPRVMRQSPDGLIFLYLPYTSYCSKTLRARREGAYRQRDDRLTFVTIDPLLEGFRQDPRYTDLPEEDASGEVG